MTCILLVAFTDWLVVGPIQVTPLGEGVTTGLRVWTGAFPARDVDLQCGVAIVAFQTNLAVWAVCGVAAGVAVTVGGVAGVSVPVTFAWLQGN